MDQAVLFCRSLYQERGCRDPSILTNAGVVRKVRGKNFVIADTSKIYTDPVSQEVYFQIRKDSYYNYYLIISQPIA